MKLPLSKLVGTLTTFTLSMCVFIVIFTFESPYNTPTFLLAISIRSEEFVAKAKPDHSIQVNLK